MRDILFGLRTLRRSPWFTLMAVFTLALGIGATTAVFSVVNAVLLRSFGYADPARLVLIRGLDKQGRSTGVSSGDFLALLQRAHSFQQVGAVRPQSFTLTGAREPENFFGEMVTAGCLSALGAAPLMSACSPQRTSHPALRRRRSCPIPRGRPAWRRTRTRSAGG